jgi:hypothetical protein
MCKDIVIVFKKISMMVWVQIMLPAAKLVMHTFILNNQVKVLVNIINKIKF